ncbi:MAG TPA: TolC family protein [Vicinamibacterales bacterium]|nr:TolC family protein [Vicinamibacterales bacterium]
MLCPSFRRRVGTLTAVIAGLSVSAFAQPGHLALDAEAAQAQPAPAAAPENVRRVSIDDAVKLALEQNLGIRIQRIEPQVSDVGVAQAKSFWVPNFTTGFSQNGQTQQPTSALSGSSQSILNNQFSSAVGLSETLPWGGSYNAGWNSSRFTSTNLFQSFSPQLNSTLNLSYTQPLLRNFSIDQIRQQVKISQKARDLSDIQLQSVVSQTLRSVKNAYWDLVYSIDNLKAQQESLALAQQSLKDNQKRVEIGTMAPIDIVQAQAEVASNEQGVIVADAAIKTAQDNLRTLILDPGAADFWTVTFEPTDVPAFREQTLDVDAAVRTALDKRLDLHAAKNSLEQSDVNIRYFRNQILPDVTAQVNYITTATGGTQLSPVDLAAIAAGESATRSVVSNRGFGSVVGDVLQSAYPNWTVGVQIGYPLGSSTARANLARARLQYQEAQTQYKNLEMQVATQVRLIARNVQTNQKRVLSARAARELQEKKLEAEEKKLAAGMSSSFFVFQAQRDLAVARTAELQAVSDYNKSLVDFQAVQEVPVGGNIGTITTAGTGAIQTGGSAIIRSGGN